MRNLSKMSILAVYTITFIGIVYNLNLRIYDCLSPMSLPLAMKIVTTLNRFYNVITLSNVNCLKINANER